MDSYTGQLWNVVGTDANSDGSGTFALVGTQLPTTPTPTTSTPRTVNLTVDGYTGVWIPLVGAPSTLNVGGTTAGEEVHYNSVTDTAALTGDENGVTRGAKFTITSTVPTTPSANKLAKLSTADVNLPTAYSVDAIVAQAQKHEGTGSAYDKLESLRKYLLTGYLSHGTQASPSVSGHGANRMTEMFPPEGTLVGDAEQYASAFALEARALNLPARVVMGFKPKITAGEKSVTVVGSDVTAWDEVDFQGVGWVSFFPTPTRTGKPPKTPPPPVSQTVTQSRQPNRVGQPQNNVLNPVAIKKPKGNASPFTLPAWVYTTVGIIVILLIVYLLPLLLIAAFKRRRMRRRRSSGRGDERVAGAWDEFTDRIAELGFRVPRGMTRGNVARALQSQLPVAADGRSDALLDFAHNTDRAVFSGEDIADPVVESAWTEATEEIARARDSVPRRRRWFARFRIRSRRGLPPALSSIDATVVADRVKELVNR
jgi:Transglutaminase-like superfamily